MIKQVLEAARAIRLLTLAAIGIVAFAPARAQQPADTPPQAQSPASTIWPPQQTNGHAEPGNSKDQSAPAKSANSKSDDQAPFAEKPKGETHITPEQAKELFSLVDTLIKFSSQETGLAIKSDVKREMTSRSVVEAYLKKKFDEDEGAKRMQRGEIVLEKFGLLDRDFALKPFLLALLKEQIEAYYDAKTKTVYMLDWVDIDEQKSVLAHELTHALQDQHIDLEKWSDQTPDEVSTNYRDDTDHLAKDEMDTAREAVTEGQATAVMMDYILKPMGKSLVKDPEVLDVLKQQMEGFRELAGFGPRSYSARRVADLSLSRGAQLRAGCVDGPGPGRGFSRNA